jgi:3-oxoacyl-[acyl-carrier protein] reductase
MLAWRTRIDETTKGETGMSGALAGKVALVTGAGKNIGRTTALMLARDGATVLVNGRSDRALVDAVVGEINAMGGQARAAMADITDEGQVARMVADVVPSVGGVDILVCNAGLRRQTPFLNMTLAEWREILSVALDGAFIIARAVVPHMIPRGAGSIVALSGISTHIGTPNRCHVSASKSGLEGFMRALAIELAPHNIRCNCVAPGSVDTVRGATAGARPATMTDDGIPLRRKATVEEIAHTIRLLAGPEGGYITGQTIHVNGGAFLT